MEENNIDWVVDTDFKANVAADMIKGDLTIEEICNKYNVTPKQAKTWADVVSMSLFGDPDAYEGIG